MTESDLVVLSPRRRSELFNSSRGSLIKGKLDLSTDDYDKVGGDADTVCSSRTFSSSSSTSHESHITGGDEPTRKINNILRQWNASFRRALRRRAQRARQKVPETLYPFLEMLLKQPDKLLSTHYSLSMSRVFLSFAAVALILGHNSFAFFFSGLALYIFKEAKRISECKFLDRWLWLSGSAMLVSVASFVAFALSTRVRKQDISTYLWLGGYLLQKISGGNLAYYMYRHVESLHFLEIHVTVLEGRDLATSPVSNVFARRARTTPANIELYHGPARLAQTTDQERKHFRFAVLSTSLDVYKTVDCRLMAPNGLMELGVAKVAIPEIRNVRVVSVFDVVDDCARNRGQLVVQIETREQSVL